MVDAKHNEERKDFTGRRTRSWALHCAWKQEFHESGFVAGRNGSGIVDAARHLEER